jgi:hypothetical protein
MRYGIVDLRLWLFRGRWAVVYVRYGAACRAMCGSPTKDWALADAGLLWVAWEEMVVVEWIEGQMMVRDAARENLRE